MEQCYNIMVYLITGSAGFIGTNLCNFLLDNGHQVIGVDNYDSGTEENTLFIKNKFDNFSFFELDICDIDYNTDMFGDIDVIINLACPSSPSFYQVNPIHTTETCVIGTLNLLKLALKYNAIFMQASTSEVYGDPEVTPQSELYKGNVNTIGIRSCYDEGKRCAESLIMDFNRCHNLQVKIFRIFNTYGPYMRADDGRVISNFINQALHNEPMTIYGDGTQTRSYQYIDDLIDGIYKFSQTDSEITGPINLGNPNEMTILDTAKKIKELMDCEEDIIFYGLPSDDPKRRMPDITLAKKLLNWEPKIDVDKGFSKTIKYFKDKLV